MFRKLYLVLVLAFIAGSLTGCGGGGNSVDLGGGVANGGLTGHVQGAGAQGILPVNGATVVAIRQDTQPISRTTQTDANGDFVLSNLPLGSYSVGYTATGFAPIQAGTGQAQSAFVESGRFLQLPPVTLTATTGGFTTSGGNVSVTLLDAATGEPVNTATVTAGVASSSVAQNGTYVLAVPGTGATPVGLSAQADGYDPSTLSPNQVTFVPGQSIAVTARLAPFAANVSGRIVVPGAFANQLSTVEIRVPGIAASYTAANVNPTTGSFRLTVPASNGAVTRVFQLLFVSPFFNLAAVSGVVAPQGGSLTLPADVVLTPIGVGLSGTVVDSGSRIPGAGSTVTIQELGTQAAVVNGSYSFTAVPIGQRLTLVASAFNFFGQLETGTVVVTPTTNGGTFVVPTIVTHP